MPFTSGVADAKATRECTEAFRGAILASGFKVVEREKLDKVLKEKELAQSGIVDSKAIETGQLLGADAVMLGEISTHEMKSEVLANDKRDTFQFQLVVRLISNVDSQTMLTLQNEYPVQVYDSGRAGLRPANLDQFRAQVLAQMAKDLEKAIKDARE